MNDGEDEEEEREELQEEVEEADQARLEPGRIAGCEEGEGEADTEADEDDPDTAQFLNTLHSPGSSSGHGGIGVVREGGRISCYKYSSTWGRELELAAFLDNF